MGGALARDLDVGAPEHRDIVPEMHDDRALLNENGELKNQNEFLRNLGMNEC